MSPAPEPKTFFEHTGNRHVYRVKVPDTYVVAAEVKAIGGDPLMLHKVRILDPGTGEQVGDVLTTDEQGIVRAVVPKNQDYRIEIVEGEIEWAPPPVPDEIEAAILRCEFTDESGVPLADDRVKIRDEDGHEFTLATDEDGRLEAPVHLGHYTLEIGGGTFEAYALLRRDLGKDEHRYRFVVHSAEAAPEAGESRDPDDRLVRLETPAEHEEEIA